MPKWNVYGRVTGGKYLGEFEAETAEAAIEKALSEAFVSLCHHCGSECSDAEVVNATAEAVPE